MHSEADLYDGELVPHAWLPDETLFSLCSRHHRLSANHRASTTCRQLFGHGTQGSAHDLPSRVDEFVARVGSALGTADQIIADHTVLPYYLSFRSPSFGAEAISAMRGPGIGALKLGLGVLTSRFRANHPLKVCTKCMEADRARWLTPYWHRTHQLPGFWICPLHGIPLHQSTLKATGIERFHWHLPASSHLSATAIGDDALPSLLALGQTAVGLVSLAPGTHFDPALTAKTYRSALRELDLLRGQGPGRLALKQIGPKYLEFVRPFRAVAELAALPSVADTAALEISRLACEPRSGTHPIRHLAVIAWLFAGLPGFLKRYQEIGRNSVEREIQGPRPRCVEHSSNDPEPKLRVISLITQSGLTPTAAARCVGVDPTTAMVWAASAGISTQKRPSKIKPDVRAQMIKVLQRGAEKTVAAQICNISIESVTRLLRTEVGLSDDWRIARFRNAQRVARRRWLRVVGSNPLSGVKAVRLLEPATFAWLYRNDREWLNSQLATLHRQVRGNNSHVDWDTRDLAISRRVREICLQIATDAPGKRIKLWQIYQRLPELKAKLSKLDRLPVTRDAIHCALSAETTPGSLLDVAARGPSRTQWRF